MNWKEIIKAETLQSVAKDMEKLFRATDWRTVMRSELVNLDERIEGMSKEEIEDLMLASTLRKGKNIQVWLINYLN